MNGDSWINLVIKMRDLPYYHYNGKPGEPKQKKGSLEDLKNRFGKYQIKS